MKITIPFFTDHNVPESAGAAIIQAGHDLVRLRDVMLTTSSDPVIAVACAENCRVLVSHDNDFKTVAKRLQVSRRQYHQLHRVAMECEEPNSARRLSELMSLIEHEWSVALHSGGVLHLAIRDKSVWVGR